MKKNSPWPRICIVVVLALISVGAWAGLAILEEGRANTRTQKPTTAKENLLP